MTEGFFSCRLIFQFNVLVRRSVNSAFFSFSHPASRAALLRLWSDQRILLWSLLSTEKQRKLGKTNRLDQRCSSPVGLSFLPPQKSLWARSKCVSRSSFGRKFFLRSLRLSSVLQVFYSFILANTAVKGTVRARSKETSALTAVLKLPPGKFSSTFYWHLIQLA